MAGSSGGSAGPGPHPCLSALSSVSTIRNQRYHIHANLSFAVLVAQILLLVSFSFKPGTVSSPTPAALLPPSGVTGADSSFILQLRIQATSPRQSGRGWSGRGPGDSLAELGSLPTAGPWAVSACALGMMGCQE